MIQMNKNTKIFKHCNLKVRLHSTNMQSSPLQSKSLIALNRKSLKVSAFLGESQTHFSQKKNILGQYSDVQIVNPEASFVGLYRACQFIEHLKAGKNRPLRVVFLNSNPEFSNIVKNNALFANQFYVNKKWVGGTLTNWKQVSQSIQAFDNFQSKWASILKSQQIHFPRLDKLKKCFSGFTSTEFNPQFINSVALQPKGLIGINRRANAILNSNIRAKLNLFHFEKNKTNSKISTKSQTQKNYNFFNQKPDVLFIVDPMYQQVAIQEARSQNIPVIALVNSDIPIDGISYPIIVNNQNFFFVDFCIGWISRILQNCQRNS